MKKEFVVTSIESAQDGSHYIYIMFANTDDYKSGERHRQQNPVFTSQEDLMKSLPKIMADLPKMRGGLSGLSADITPAFKMSMKEYEDMGLKVGDKVSIEIKKLDNARIYT
jgi:hypothetical protein